MRSHLILPVCLLAVLLLSLSRQAAPTADLVLTDGKIFTSDTAKPFVQALAIKDNIIIASGTNGEVEKLVSKKTKRINLEGKTVVPGFNDAHDHLGWFAPIGQCYQYNELNAAGPDKEAVLDSVARLVKLAKPGQWICGFIGTEILYDSSIREALDRIAPDHPVLLQIWWGHGLVVNEKALAASGLSDQSVDPLGGWYERVGNSNKISALHQNAQLPVWNAWSVSEPDMLIKGLRSYAQEQLSGGITSVQQMSSTLNGPESIRIFKKAKLPQRIRIIAWPHTTANGRLLEDWNFKRADITPLVHISGIKYTIDGTPMEGNALRTSPYPDRPNWYGRLNYPIDTMNQIFREALASDRQLMMHLTADSSFSVVLSLMQQMATGEQWKSKRVRIEHNCVGDISSAQQAILKDLGIIMMHTPKYCTGSPLRSLVGNGVGVGIAPDGTTNPFVDIMIACSMQADPTENLTIEQAVIAYTKNNAYAEFMESSKGTLKKGMLADLAVLSQDIFTIPIQQLPATQSVLTIIDGKIVYQQSPGIISGTQEIR